MFFLCLFVVEYCYGQRESIPFIIVGMKDRKAVIELLEFIKKSPTSFHAVANFEKMAMENGFIELDEKEPFSLQKGKKYYIKRGGSSIIAFCIPKAGLESFSIIAAHTDSPTFKLKRNPESRITPYYTTLNVEGYGGMIISTWFDRPLSIAGRCFYRINGAIKESLVDFDRDLVLIPSLAIHQNRDVNSGYHYHIQKDVAPLISLSGSGFDFSSLLENLLGVRKEDILDYDLYLYNRTPYSVWGANDEFISSPRLDDTECAYSAFKTLMEVDGYSACPMVALFDSEEVGSSSLNGALSDFLVSTVERICLSLGLDREHQMMAQASSFIISADNAHALHPNYPEKSDPTNKVVLNGGIVIKYSSNKKYTTDAYSASVIRLLMEENSIRHQSFFNNSDIPGGSTLGNLSMEKISIPSVDIGLAQLAMHSSYESAGAEDLIEMDKLFRIFLSR